MRAMVQAHSISWLGLSAAALLVSACAAGGGGTRKPDAVGTLGEDGGATGFLVEETSGFGTSKIDIWGKPAEDTGAPVPDPGTTGGGMDTYVIPIPDFGTGAGVTGSESDTGPVKPPPGDGPDKDGDGWPDTADNCPENKNDDQANLDHDLQGDACDNDLDGDGVFNTTDCQPADGTIFQGNPEKCNGIDDDCNGETDPPKSKGCTRYYLDGDGDGAGLTDTEACACQKELPNQVTLAGDCDDANPQIGPYAPETCNDFDDNCNLLVDDGCDDDQDGYCDALLGIVGSPTICPKGGGDCFDYSAMVHPYGVEVEANGLDDDCDGTKVGEPTGNIQANCGAMPCVGQSTDAILCGLEICFPGLDVVQNTKVTSPTGSDTSTAWNVVKHFGNVNNDLKPQGGNSYVLLATGPATGTSHSLDLGGFTAADPFSKDGYETHDNMEITLTLKAPPGAKGFTIDYVFFSEEYEEYIGSSFNDKFYMVLTAPQTTGGQQTVINYTACSNPSVYSDFTKDGKKWCYIAINTAFSEPCSNPSTKIGGTGFECGPATSSYGSSTGWLQTSWPIKEGEQFTLTFHIHDTSDGIYDSEVILDHFRWELGSFVQGTASHN